MSEMKNRFLDWYNSLTERNKRILVIFVSILLPALSFYVYAKQMNERSRLEQKLLSVQTVNQIKSQILTLEKKRLFYEQQIPELKAMLINPSTDYACNTQLNQIPVILNSEISSYKGYVTAFKEGIPVEITVDGDGNTVHQIKGKSKKSGKPGQIAEIARGGIFKVELLPVKLIVVTNKDRVISFLNNFNTPDSAYPFVLIKDLSFGFGKVSGCNSVFSNQSYVITSNAVTTTSPVNICITGYAIAGISEVQSPSKRGGENGKKH